MTILEINPFTCTKNRSSLFATGYGSGGHGSGRRLRDYLKQLTNGTVVVGVSRDEATMLLKPALPTLQELFGVNVADVEFKGSFAFIAQKSHPAKAVLEKVVNPEDSYDNPAHVNEAVISGKKLL